MSPRNTPKEGICDDTIRLKVSVTGGANGALGPRLGWRIFNTTSTSERR